MSQELTGLEIQVHLVDGSIARFAQPDPRLAQGILDAIRPERLFQQRQMTVVSEGSVTALPTAAVARVDLLGRQVPRWSFGEWIARIEEISEEEFHSPTRREGARMPVGGPSPERPLILFRELALVNSERVFSEIWIAPPPDAPREALPKPTGIDHSLAINRLLAAPVLGCWRKGSDGAILVNPDRVVRISFFPGPREAPAGTWLASSVIG